MKFFAPILAGATWRDRTVACVGALVSIALTGLICGAVLGRNPALPLIVAPLGASAVLLFAVPASPLAQPWSIIGGNTLSALVGVVVAMYVHDQVLAIGIAVALAIGVMSLTRSLHPPGGAAAMTAVLGGPVVAQWGLLFPLAPVAINTVVMVLLGMLFHRFSGHSYPHKPAAVAVNTHGTKDVPPAARAGVTSLDVDAALRQLHESFDIDRADLAALVAASEAQALIRSHGALKCRDIMSRDVVKVEDTASAARARQLLMHHDIRAMPVIDHLGRLLGTVGLREVVESQAQVGDLVSPAVTVSIDAPAVSLVPILTDGRTRAVLVMDGERLAGLVTQTDLLAALAHGLVANANAEPDAAGQNRA